MIVYRGITKGVVEDLMTFHNAYVRDTPALPYGASDTLNGVTLEHKTANLAKEIIGAMSRSMVRLKFVVMDGQKYGTSVGLYREGDAFLMGVVGWDPVVGKYYVSHPSIKNNKYSPDKPAHFCIMSDGTAHIVKAFKTHCGAPSLQEVIQHAVMSHLMSKFRTAYTQSKDEFEILTSRYVYSHRLAEEVSNMLRGGTLSTEIKEVMAKYDVLKAEAEAEKNSRVNLCLFMFSQLPSGDTFTKFQNIGTVSHSNLSASFMWSPDPARYKSYSTYEALPTEIMQKISALSLMGNKSYIKGLGFKYCSNVFAVEISTDLEDEVRKGVML